LFVALSSRLFWGDAKLEAAAVKDASHIVQGARGEHVVKIQTALNLLDGAALAMDGIYGPRTAAAVLAYKQKRGIINLSYQTRADDIVGKMTIAALDRELQRLVPHSLSVNFLLSASLTSGLQTPRTVIVTEPAPTSVKWAQQVVDFCQKNQSSLPIMPASKVVVPVGNTPAQIADVYKGVATQAGAGGCIIVSVGHGGASPVGDQDVGMVDLGPSNAFKVAGRNCLLVGEILGGKRRPLTIPPTMNNDDIDFFHTEVFYADPKPPPSHSRKEDDEANSANDGPKARLANWKAYEDIAAAIKGARVGLVVFMTCVVGKAPGMLRKMASQWGCDILAYKRLIAIGEASNRRARAFFENDPEGTDPNVTSNTPLAEVMPPPSRDAVWIRKP
jgi:peptidoglycan hydrolase-like protein with peptidoglycan-binding domain